METLFREFYLGEEIPMADYTFVMLNGVTRITDDESVAIATLDSEADNIARAYKGNDLVFDKAQQ